MSTDAQPEKPVALFQIPQVLQQRILMAHLTPAKLTHIFGMLEQGVNQHGLNDAAVNLDFTMEGEEYTANDLLPTIVIGVRKANPDGIVTPTASKLILPGG